jgi:predicted MFS family arabinose efflux permease
VFILSAALVLFIRPQPVDTRLPEDRQNGFRISTRFVIYLGTVFLAMIAVSLPQPLASNFLQNNRGLSISQIGQLGSIAGVGIVVLNLVFGHFNARRGFLFAQVSVGLFSLVMWKGTGFPWFMAGYFLLGGARVTRSLASAQTRELVHSSRMGLAYGITETVNSLAYILAPPLAGYLYTYDPTWMFSAGFLLVVVSLIVGMSINPMRKSVSQEILSDSKTSEEILD